MTNKINFTNVLFSQKIDADTLLAAALAGVTEDSRFMPYPNVKETGWQDRLQAMLNDPTTLCIEAGGSGQVELLNFDHHGQGADIPKVSACWQVWETIGHPENSRLLVEYINMLDLGGRNSLGVQPKVGLTDILAGIILTGQDNRWSTAVYVREANVVFDTVISEELDPFSDFSNEVRWQKWIDRKSLEDEMAANAALNILKFSTDNGLILGVLVSNWRNATSSIYEGGCHFAVALCPNMGGNGRKLTVGVNTRLHPTGTVTDFLKALNEIEPGAGGPPNGGVGGSKFGTTVELEKFIELAQKYLK